MTVIQSLRRTLGRGVRPQEARPDAPPTRATATPVATAPEVDIGPTDPLLAYLAAAPGPVDLPSLRLDSQGVRDLRAAGAGDQDLEDPLDHLRKTGGAVDQDALSPDGLRPRLPLAYHTMKSGPTRLGWG